MLKRTLLMACKNRFYHGSALESAEAYIAAEPFSGSLERAQLRTRGVLTNLVARLRQKRTRDPKESTTVAFDLGGFRLS